MGVRWGKRNPIVDRKPYKGRGAVSNTTGRYEHQTIEPFDDGWSDFEQDTVALKTTVQSDSTRSVLAFNQSPDVPFDRSINPYRGCEHGCVYCFARPSHAYLGFSPGIDFETRLFSKPNAAKLLSKELRKSGYQCQPVALGINTDAYQPIERQLKITRSILEVLRDFNHPVSIVTKSSMVERDIDILTDMASRNQASVCVSVTTLDGTLARKLEPRATAPQRRLHTIAALAEAGIPVTTLIAPVIPVLTDPELESIVEAVASAGATSAGYILLRLPLEVACLFEEWLQTHYPLKAEHVMKRVRDTQGGKNYDSRFGHRMRGSGAFALIIEKRFARARTQYNLGIRDVALNCSAFKPPQQSGDQIGLFE
ncbi:MAG: PA0069 family radical SAM protein [Pseudomonadota bacterium]